MLRIGDFHLLAASVGAQLLMLAVTLLGRARPGPDRGPVTGVESATMDVALAIFNIGVGLGVLAAGVSLVVPRLADRRRSSASRARSRATCGAWPAPTDDGAATVLLQRARLPSSVEVLSARRGRCQARSSQPIGTAALERSIGSGLASRSPRDGPRDVASRIVGNARGRQQTHERLRVRQLPGGHRHRRPDRRRHRPAPGPADGRRASRAGRRVRRREAGRPRTRRSTRAAQPPSRRAPSMLAGVRCRRWGAAPEGAAS